MKSAFGEVVSQTSQFFLSSSKSSPRVKTVNLQDVAELVELCDGDVATPECDPAQHGECEIADTGLDLAADCQREAGPAVRARHLPILRLCSRLPPSLEATRNAISLQWATYFHSSIFRLGKQTRKFFVRKQIDDKVSDIKQIFNFSCLKFFRFLFLFSCRIFVML